MKLTNLEIKEINKKYYNNNRCDSSNKKTVNNISIDTFDIVNSFLTEIKLSTKTNNFNTANTLKNFEKRLNAYNKLYMKYYNKVIQEDRLIFSKLINYLTAEGKHPDPYSMSSSNMPLALEYKASYKDKTVDGIYYGDKEIYIESDIHFEFHKNISKSLLIDDYGDLDDKYCTKLISLLDNIKFELYTLYNIKFNINNIAKLKEQVSNILNSPHFIGWQFQGVRDEFEEEILDFIFAAKKEVTQHANCNKVILNDINIDTVRYAKFLQSQTTRLHDDISTLYHKIEKYNKLYPYIYNQITPGNRDFFAKFANYITFENENYSISGYCVHDLALIDYYIYEKKEVIKRHNLSNQLKKLCEGRKSQKNHNPGYIGSHFMGLSDFCDSYQLSFYREQKCIESLDRILSNELFINWKFYGLKTEEEMSYKLPDKDLLKPLGFSESSFFVLSYFINYILGIETASARSLRKDELLEDVLKLIPQNEANTFMRILDYFTDGSDTHLNVDPSLVNISAWFKIDGISVLKRATRVSNLADIPKAEIVKSIKEQITFDKNKKIKKSIEDITEDNLFKNVIAMPTFRINILPVDFFGTPLFDVSKDGYKKYILETFKLISSLSLNMTKANLNIGTSTKSSKCTEAKIDNSYNLFDYLNNLNAIKQVIDSNEKEITAERSIKYSSILVDDIEVNFNESGQLSFAI